MVDSSSGSMKRLAEEVGFEPTVPFRTHAISSRAH